MRLIFAVLIALSVGCLAQTTGIEWTGQNATDEISLGAVSGDASFSEAIDWSYLAFIKLNDGGGNKSFASMYGSAANRHINFYVPSSAGKLAVRADLNNATVNVLTADTMSINTWYLVMLSNDASESNNFRIFIMDMDGDLADSTSSTLFTTDHGLSAELVLGNRNTIHAFRGSMAFVSYFTAYYGVTEMQAYIQNPTGFKTDNLADNQFFLSLPDTLGNTGVHSDEGSSGNDGTEGNAGTLIQDANGPVFPVLSSGGGDAESKFKAFDRFGRYGGF